jgi:hypothetical protein
MAFEDEDVYPEHPEVEVVVGGLLRVGLLFGTLVILAVALIVSQVYDGRIGRDYADSQAITGVDRMATGSIGRTVVQPAPVSSQR